MALTMLLKVFTFEGDTSEQRILPMNVDEETRTDMQNGTL